MHLLKNRSMRFYFAFFLILTMAIGGSAIASFASGGPTTVTVTGAAGVTESGPSSAQATAVTLNGDDQTTTYSMALTVTDATGSGTGWNLTISSSQFTGATPANKLDANASSIIAAPTESCISAGGHCTDPSNSVTYAPLIVNASAVKFFNATAGTGRGKFTITPTVTIAIPANTIADTYTSTVTVAIVSGP